MSLTEPRWSAFLGAMTPFTVKDYMYILADVAAFRTKIYQYLQEKQIDMIICPGWYMPAFKLGSAKVLLCEFRNLALWLLLLSFGMCSTTLQVQFQ